MNLIAPTYCEMYLVGFALTIIWGFFVRGFVIQTWVWDAVREIAIFIGIIGAVAILASYEFYLHPRNLPRFAFDVFHHLLIFVLAIWLPIRHTGPHDMVKSSLAISVSFLYYVALAGTNGTNVHDIYSYYPKNPLYWGPIFFIVMNLALASSRDELISHRIHKLWKRRKRSIFPSSPAT